MSALAQFHVQVGGRASGSDRAFDQGERQRVRAALAKLGVSIAPQDGSGLASACDAVIVSTAVEDSVPDIRAARRLGIPVLHRSELLARYVASYRTLAVTGTSGKSTVTALIFTLLRDTGRDPSLLTGGALVDLMADGYLGNAWAGGSDLLVIEADESDGSLVRYTPWAGVLLNLRRDHKEPAELREIFAAFRQAVTGPFVIGEDENLSSLATEAVVFGTGPDCHVRAEDIELGPDDSSFSVAGVRFDLPLPGHHNVINATAAIAVCTALGVAREELVAPLAGFRGVARRFQTVDTVAGIEVIDDFAHNPDKIGAALSAARIRLDRAGDGRLLAVFQPHGFGPTRFLRDDLVATFTTHLLPTDHLWLPEIYYAGGTVHRDISSRDLVEAVAAAGIPATFSEKRPDIAQAVASKAKPGDLVLVMGARDPSLTDFCGEIVRHLRERPA
jgi:UDP-N-acetylmuramate--alanine ligase